MGDVTPTPQPLNRAGRRAEARTSGTSRTSRTRKAGALAAAFPAALGTTALLLGAAATPADALCSLQVSNLTDTGAGSLRDAVACASDGDTVTFQSGLTGTIPLAAEIAVGSSVTIQGPGAGVIAVSGQDLHRIFNVSIGGGASGHFTVSGLTLEHGNAASGGAILDANEDLTLTGVTFDANHSTGEGGAINAATVDPAVDITINDSAFTGNSADGYGGAMNFTEGGSLAVTNTTFDHNQAGGGGGAFHVTYLDGPITISDSHFTHNTAAGPGGAADIWYSDVDLNIDATTVTDNSAGGNGGGLYIYDLRSVTISNSDISDNTGRVGGGVRALYFTNDFTIRDSTLTGNTETDSGGGGLYLKSVDGNVLLDAVTLSDNHAESGGAGASIKTVGGTLGISHSTVSGNSAAGYGGGLYVNDVDGTTTIDFTTIADNTTDDSAGGIEWYENGGNLVIRNSTLSGNTAHDKAGGVYFSSDNYGTFAISNSTISGNTAGEEGGAITFNGWYGLTIVESTVTANRATTVGGIYIASETKDATVSAKPAKTETHTGQARPGGESAPAPSGRAHATARSGTHGKVTLTGVILAGDAGADIGIGGTAAVTSSIIGKVSTTPVVDKGGNLFGVDPLLGALADNGGPTKTHALLPGSPAIDAGPNPLTPFPGSDFDQRGDGYARVVAGIVDIGAFEVQPVIIQPTFTG